MQGEMLDQYQDPFGDEMESDFTACHQQDITCCQQDPTCQPAEIDNDPPSFDHPDGPLLTRIQPVFAASQGTDVSTRCQQTDTCCQQVSQQGSQQDTHQRQWRVPWSVPEWQWRATFDKMLELLSAMQTQFVKKVYPFGAVDIAGKDGVAFKVNRQRLKVYVADQYQEERAAMHLTDPTPAEP